MAASIPNPLFDLAGITCGHFLVPFWTFFGATLIGKAIIKMHLQMLFIIIIFSKDYLSTILQILEVTHKTIGRARIRQPRHNGALPSSAKINLTPPYK